ncbi:lysosome-associated membrane glycoprotein 5 [Neodiprion pinetum]|uniref:Lysosome-associated membrane glycoprotein 2 n=2 Tax=Neodiprion TaxID=270857 RepID=A0A6J0CBW9_NEOLC|nr:lysosome-associated membrane glycoprotein 2 [Neodiprion lecontei]XP_046471417.1 lysosome-associated membrane glycoprotein 2 [Neodiprion pinetum]
MTMARTPRTSPGFLQRYHHHRQHRAPVALARVVLPLWCILGTVLSGPAHQATQELDSYFTTSRPVRIIVDMATQKPRIPLILYSDLKTTTTTTTTTTSTVSTPSSSGEQPLYRVNGSNGQACILLQVDAIITVKYKTKVGEEREADIYVPNDATVTGNCANDNSATMSLKWKVFVLFWSFARSPGGEGWYVDKIELTYNSSDRHFELIDQPNKTVRLTTGKKHSTMFFPTPVGKSYACNEKEIPLTDGKTHATVLLREMKLQPFKFKSNTFATEFWCKPERATRDETAPVAVGSTLAAAVLLTITGYAAYRYFKVKKVQYDTME